MDDSPSAPLEAAYGIRDPKARWVVSPYRICPVGAHSDHQGGMVLGMGISAGTRLAFAPAPDRVVLRSANYPGTVEFRVADAANASGEGWARYALGAAAVLRPKLPSHPRGFFGYVDGMLPGSGLSSSASVNLAYLLALASVNDIELDAKTLAILAMRVETEHLRLKCGLLDPASIAVAERDKLVLIDCREESWTLVTPGERLEPYRILIAYSGISRNLTGTDFNRRVDECFAAAVEIGRRSGHSARRLGDLPDDVLEASLHTLPEAWARRTRHFMSERRRVLAAVRAWTNGDLASMGALMDASCLSSIEDYQCGSEELHALHQILQKTPGVMGNRFSGGGYGGSCVALVRADRADEARNAASAAFADRFPHLAKLSRFFLVESSRGAHIA